MNLSKQQSYTLWGRLAIELYRWQMSLYESDSTCDKSFMTTQYTSKPWKMFSPVNKLALQSQRTWIGGIMYLIFHLKQLIRLRLGFLRRNLAFPLRSTKEVAYKTMLDRKLEYAAPIWNTYSKIQTQQVEKVQQGQHRDGPTVDGATLVVLAKCPTRCNSQLLRPRATSPLYFSSTGSIVGLTVLQAPHL